MGCQTAGKSLSVLDPSAIMSAVPTADETKLIINVE